jgi:hypothetical protein
MEPSSNNEIIGAAECADMLDSSQAQVEEEARNGDLPGFKVGRSWRFVRRDLIEFLAERGRREAAERQARRRASASGVLSGATVANKKRSRRTIPPPLPQLGL